MYGIYIIIIIISLWFFSGSSGDKPVKSADADIAEQKRLADERARIEAEEAARIAAERAMANEGTVEEPDPVINTGVILDQTGIVTGLVEGSTGDTSGIGYDIDFEKPTWIREGETDTTIDTTNEDRTQNAGVMLFEEFNYIRDTLRARKGTGPGDLDGDGYLDVILPYLGAGKANQTMLGSQEIANLMEEAEVWRYKSLKVVPGTVVELMVGEYFIDSNTGRFEYRSRSDETVTMTIWHNIPNLPAYIDQFPKFSSDRISNLIKYDDFPKRLPWGTAANPNYYQKLTMRVIHPFPMKTEPWAVLYARADYKADREPGDEYLGKLPPMIRIYEQNLAVILAVARQNEQWDWRYMSIRTREPDADNPYGIMLRFRAFGRQYDAEAPGGLANLPNLFGVGYMQQNLKGTDFDLATALNMGSGMEYRAPNMAITMEVIPNYRNVVVSKFDFADASDPTDDPFA